MRDRLPDLTAVSRKPHSGPGRRASCCGSGQRPQEEPGEWGWKVSRRGVQKQDPKRSLSRGPGGEPRRGPWGGSPEEERPWRELGSVFRRESNKRVLGVPGPPEASVSPGVVGRSLQEGSRQPPSRVPGSELSVLQESQDAQEEPSRCFRAESQGKGSSPWDLQGC